VKQRSGYGIFLKSHKLAAWYEQSLARNETSDPARILKDSSFPQRSSYRGIFRLPLIAWPSSDSPSAGAATERDQTNRSARQLVRRFKEQAPRTEDYLKDDDDNLLDSIDQAQQVFALLERAEDYEICLLRRERFEISPNTLGFDVGYWGGDHFSLVADSYVVPAWRPPPPQDQDEVKSLLSVLNKQMLFDSAAEARVFLDFYRSKAWAEKERYEGEFQIIQVDHVPAAVYL